MSKKKNSVVIPFRPDGWKDKLPGMIQDYIDAGGLDIDDSERQKIEGFIKYCIKAGADAMLEGLRAYGIDALVKDHRILFVLSKIAVPGRPQYGDPGMKYKDTGNYSGPGCLAFIPADNVVFKGGKD